MLLYCCNFLILLLMSKFFKKFGILKGCDKYLVFINCVYLINEILFVFFNLYG